MRKAIGKSPSVLGIEEAALVETLKSALPTLSCVDKADVTMTITDMELDPQTTHRLTSILAEGSRKKRSLMQDYTTLLDMFTEQEWDSCMGPSVSRKRRLESLFMKAVKFGCVAPSEVTKADWAKAIDALENKDFKDATVAEIRSEWKRYRRNVCDSLPDPTLQFEKLPCYENFTDAQRAKLFPGGVAPVPRKLPDVEVAGSLVRLRKRAPTVLKLGVMDGSSCGHGEAAHGFPMMHGGLGQLGAMAVAMMENMKQMQLRFDRQDKLIEGLMQGKPSAAETAESKRSRMLADASRKKEAETAPPDMLAITNGVTDSVFAVAACSHAVQFATRNTARLILPRSAVIRSTCCACCAVVAVPLQLIARARRSKTNHCLHVLLTAVLVQPWRRAAKPMMQSETTSTRC